MGASGAGLATFLSNCAACVYFFILLYCRRGKTFVCLQPSMLKADWTALKEICGVGVPASIQNLLNVTGMTVLNNFTSSFGPDTVAAMGIAQKINMIPLYITLGFSQGVMPLISYSYSGKHYRRMRDIILFSVKLSVGFMTVVSLGYYLGSDQLIFLFMKNETIIQYGGSFLQGLCLALPFLCLDFLAVGVFQACGLGRKALAFAILRKIVLEIPALFLLNPMYGLAYAQLSAELVLSSAAVITVTRLMNRMEKIDK